MPENVPAPAPPPDHPAAPERVVREILAVQAAEAKLANAVQGYIANAALRTANDQRQNFKIRFAEGVIDTEEESVANPFSSFGFTTPNSIPTTPPTAPFTPTKEGPDKAPPPVERVSLFCRSYPKSSIEDWHYYPGAGWVMVTQERDTFLDTYAQCALSGEWALKTGSVGRKKSQETGGTSNGSVLNWVYVSSDGAPAAMALAHHAVRRGYGPCAMSGRYYPKAELIEALSGDDKRVMLHKSRARELIRCDLTGKANYLPGSLSQVRKSKKYHWVAPVAAKSSGLFAVCSGCGDTFESVMVKAYPEETHSNSPFCSACVFPILKKRVILAHNAKDYPRPIASRVTRLGARVDDNGVLHATGEAELVAISRLFGVEVETEMSLRGVKKDGLNRVDLALAIRDTLGRDFAIIKEDGTLLTNGKYSDSESPGLYYAGFEIVSAPADLATHRERWNRLPQALGFKHLRAWDTETCGFHIHVSRESLTLLQISRILVFVNAPGVQPFVHKVAGRGSDTFCTYHPRKLTDSLHPERVISPKEEEGRNRARRVAVNLSNPHTVEFRIFRGTISPKHMIRNLEFVDAVCDFCYPGSRSLKEYENPSAFVEFVNKNRKQWPLFAEWLAATGHIQVKHPTQLPSSAQVDKRTLKPETVEEVAVDTGVGAGLERELGEDQGEREDGDDDARDEAPRRPRPVNDEGGDARGEIDLHNARPRRLGGAWARAQPVAYVAGIPYPIDAPAPVAPEVPRAADLEPQNPEPENDEDENFEDEM